MQRSHLFVIQGDLRKIHADGYLIPSSDTLNFGADWRGILPRGADPTYTVVSGDGRPRLKWATFPRKDADRPSKDSDEALVLITDIASATGSIPHLLSGLDVALKTASERWDRAPRTRRERPLLAMPVIGTGRGGFRGVQGAVVRELLGVLDRRLPSLSYDVALVCFDRAQYAAVQMTRLQEGLCLPSLPESFNAHLGTLVEHAAAGSLGVLFGAGVSIPLGLPNWQDLLRNLAKGTSAEHLGDLSGVDPIDAAALVQSAMDEPKREEFLRRLRQQVDVDRHSLAHGLLASLRPAVAITTNYDRGYELALEHVLGETPALMPWAPAERGDSPRVLKLHGDVTLGSVILSREDFVMMHSTRRPLTAPLQEQMLAQHVLAVGTSMSDSTLVGAISEVEALLRSIDAERQLGTYVMTVKDPVRAELLGSSMEILFADEPVNAGERWLEPHEAARVVDMLLDAIGLQAIREHNYLADREFEDLIKDNEQLMAIARQARDLRQQIEKLEVVDHQRWGQITAALDGLGAKLDQR